jgi:hypothetical protein
MMCSLCVATRKEAEGTALSAIPSGGLYETRAGDGSSQPIFPHDL